MLIDFDDEFAGVSEYADLYYKFGLQVVPAMLPSSGKNWKRPSLAKWREFTSTQVSVEKYYEWFGTGSNPNVCNIGILTGMCSGGVFIVDLDTYKNPEAQLWFDGICADNNAGVIVEAPTQRTGGGGIQMLFRAPKGWTPPTIKTSIGVDIRGQGGFAVMAPSAHESGRHYEWVDGLEPWQVEIPEAPEWLCREIDELARVYGGHITTASGDRIRTETPQHKTDAWGKITDGREDRMTRLVFRAIVDLYRDCPILDNKEMEEAKVRCFTEYVDLVETRLKEIGVPKHILLEREGRGKSLFEHKWRATLRQWDTKISEEAQRPWDNKTDPFDQPLPSGSHEQTDDVITSEEPTNEDQPKTEKKLLKLYTLDEVDEFVPPKAIIQDIVAENSLGFIYGPPGCGKTFVALSMGLSVAYGMDKWLFDKKIEKSGPVVYISLEGRGDIKYRTQAWRKFHDRPSNNFFRLVLDQVNFMNDASIAEFVKALDDFITSNPRPVLIFIDTVSRAIAGSDENDQKDMSKFIETCDKVKLRYSTAVVGVHHSGRVGTNMRGSTVMDGGSDFLLRVERKKEDQNMVGHIHAEKIKAYPDGWSKAFKLIKMDLDAFGVHTSLVATWEPEKTTSEAVNECEGFGGKAKVDAEPDMETCKKMVAAIHEAWVGGYPWSRDEKGRESDRYAADRLSDSFGFTVEVCKRYVNMWHRNDVIVSDMWGEKGQKKGLRRGKGL